MGLGWDRRVLAHRNQAQGALEGSRDDSTPYLLLIESNDDDVFLTLRSLARQQFDIPVRVVGDGVQALDELNECEALPLAVLVSYRLPRMSGLDLIDTLRANDRTKDTPAILLTSSENEREHIFGNGGTTADVDGWMVKPVRCDALIEQLRSLELIDGSN